MSGPSPSAAPAPDAYAAIEATMRATEPGRRFLAEHARRARGEDTQTLLAAIQRVERTVMADRGPDGVGHLRGDLMEMAAAISRTKAEIAAISEPDQDQTRLALASQALDAIVRATEHATSDILGAAEAVQEAAWSLRERGADPTACDALDRHATTIYTACSFQDLTAQRTARIVYTLRYLEDRLAAMIAIWSRDGDRIPPPQAPAGPKAEDLCQSDVDRYIAMDVPAVTAAAIVALPGAPTLHEDIVFVPVAEVERAEAAEAAAAEPVPGLWAAAAEAPGGPVPGCSAGPWSGLGLAEIDALSPEMRLALFA
ncbi:hypothetical protein Q8W71_25210 [Methylobacterium sp. NEAU 140]|uniref:hypothetical protein n=1 Tax=Methylobacterium sp. NEAU 140 TaxID=3064945 RepID=UPI0027347F66|nr:hypothetical protein [Methylobacterium sp. NEAU 140]MDP4025936.1 hypothetical protein [Methylobacterium sp. NEAU 140]